MALKSKALIAALAALIAMSPGCRRKERQVVLPPDTGAALDLPDDPGVSQVAVANPLYKDRLLKGFYGGSNQWLWTAPVFAVRVDPPMPPQKTYLDLEGSVPEELIAESHAVTLTARVNGIEVGKKSWSKAARVYEHWEVPARALETRPAVVEYTLTPGAVAKDPPERVPKGAPFGLIVVSVGLRVDEEGLLDRPTAANLARQGQLRMLAERDRLLNPAKQKELLNLFHQVPVWTEMWFQNVKIEKLPLDLWMVQQLVYEQRPEFIVETGTWHGGSALYFANALNSVGLKRSRVLTVDVQNLTANAATNPLWKEYVTFLHGSSTDPAIVSKIADLTRGRRTLVMLDSDHSKQHVLNELHAYAPMVPRGSYLIVEDTHLDGVPSNPEFGPGPAAAVQEFLAEPLGQGFQADRAREAYIMTFNPGGWLRRK